MADPAILDEAKRDAFLAKVVGDTSGWGSTVMAALGDRLGLFKDLAACGPATSVQLAARLQLNERYVREWLSGMTAAGYLEYEATGGSFRLPPEHIPVLAQENGLAFFGGAHQFLVGLADVFDQVEGAFRAGGGVTYESYGSDVWDGMERFIGRLHENLLVQQWLPAAPDVQTLLERGVQVADVGCGRGRAVLRLAQAFPNSRFIGYDLFAPSVERVTANAAAAGLSERVSFVCLNAATGLPDRYDVILTTDVVHDAVDPLALLTSIRRALRPNGRYFCMDVNCSEHLEENVGPMASLRYTFSMLYCMTTSLAQGGYGLGTMGLHEAKMQELCAAAGFSRVRRAPIPGLYNIFECEP